MWLKVEGFKDLVRKWWTCYNFSGYYSHILACKLKALKQDLKVWNREVFGNVPLNKNIALSQIGFWDAKERDCEKGDWRPSISGLPFSFFDSVEARLLEEAFSVEEVQTAIFGLNGDKAPGPDEFTLAFWKFCWDIVKHEVMGFFAEFHSSNRFERILNSTFIVLIPKKGAILDKMGFGIKWVNWMRWCISSTRFSILLNGSPVGFFQSSRGLRQGDSLSPFLFILAMEALSSILNKALQGGFLEDFMDGGRGGEGVVVSHILFADDTLVFCDASKEHVEGVGLQSGFSSSCYLGLPLGVAFKSSWVWDVVEKRFQKRLALWKRRYLSKEGRLTLAKSTLSSLPIYFMSLFIIPRKVSLRLEKIQRDFLWGESFSKFASEQDSLWNQVIVSKFGEEEGRWCSGASREIMEWGFGRRLGMGGWSLAKGWLLRWGWDAWVTQLWDQSGNLGHWNPVFTRLNNDREMEEVETFFNRLHGHALRRVMRMSCLVGFQRKVSLQLSLSSHP
ncbi:hypothetical protein CK203_072861 [Vitis vinifera]|uniref:Reverse transcriptase domain-containing protein n=1 Tax=Vitis vinifera TaxID=29760 RepID=A0A438DMA4_VITVI|nr:hypothetical protein CK203_072861 [Vitis vinifera]